MEAVAAGGFRPCLALAMYERLPCEAPPSAHVAAELFATLTRVVQSGAQATAQHHSFSKGCAMHIGFYTNAQAIEHLLHLVVQLALYPRPPMADAETQRSATEGKVVACVQAGSPVFSEMEAQTEETWYKGQPRIRAAVEKARQFDSCGVRIGGGYMVVRTASRERTEAVTKAYENRVSQAQQTVEEKAVDTSHAFAHGAPSEATTSLRFNVGAYRADAGRHRGQVLAHDVTHTSHPEDLEAAQLYRVLRPSTPRTYGAISRIPPRDIVAPSSAGETKASRWSHASTSASTRPSSARSSRDPPQRASPSTSLPPSPASCLSQVQGSGAVRRNLYGLHVAGRWESPAEGMVTGATGDVWTPPRAGRCGVAASPQVQHQVLQKVLQCIEGKVNVEREATGGDTSGHSSMYLLLQRLGVDASVRHAADQWTTMLRQRAGIACEEVSDEELEVFFEATGIGHADGLSFVEFDQYVHDYLSNS